MFLSLIAGCIWSVNWSRRQSSKVSVGELCAHGNLNVLTRDIGTSSLSQGCAGQHVLVEIERLVVEAPPVRAYDPPIISPLDDSLCANLMQRKQLD